MNTRQNIAQQCYSTVTARLKTWLSYSFICILVLSLSACSHLGVEPWERDLLAKKHMALTPSQVDAALDDHIYFSKEASSGGKNFAGGGCGCN